MFSKKYFRNEKESFLSSYLSFSLRSFNQHCFWLVRSCGLYSRSDSKWSQSPGVSALLSLFVILVSTLTWNIEKEHPSDTNAQVHTVTITHKRTNKGQIKVLRTEHLLNFSLCSKPWLWQLSFMALIDTFTYMFVTSQHVRVTKSINLTSNEPCPPLTRDYSVPPAPLFLWSTTLIRLSVAVYCLY